MSVDSICFVDTNILVYADSRSVDPRKAKATDLVQSLIRADRFCTSTQVLQELYVTLVKKQNVSPQAARLLVEDLATNICFRIDVAAILEAARASVRLPITFWDALIVTAATRLGASVIYSEHLNHNQSYDGIELINPFR